MKVFQPILAGLVLWTGQISAQEIDRWGGDNGTELSTISWEYVKRGQHLGNIRFMNGVSTGYGLNTVDGVDIWTYPIPEIPSGVTITVKQAGGTDPDFVRIIVPEGFFVEPNEVFCEDRVECVYEVWYETDMGLS